MADELTCPRCGADGKVIATGGFTRYDCLSVNDGGKFHQHARCKRIELERLRAVVERLRTRAESTRRIAEDRCSRCGNDGLTQQFFSEAVILESILRCES